MERLELFKTAKAKCLELLERYPEAHGVLHSIMRQIDYLTDLETGANEDRSRLKDIMIGTQAVREIEDLDKEVARVLRQVSDHARHM